MTTFRSVFAAGALLALLGACVPDPSLVEAGLARAPESKVAQNVYVASMDNGFPVAAVPVEKVPMTYQRQTVYFPTDEVPGTIVINPATKLLHFVTGKNEAIRYGIGVGKAGFEWSGVALVTDRKPWPTWTPPKEMIARKPELAKFEKGQPGGPTNPLGARALYLTTNGVDYGYRIHGTPEWWTIGTNASSGCIRMIQQDILDLYARVPVGSKVIVLNADGSYPTGLKLPPPEPKPAVKVKARAAAAPTPAPAAPPAIEMPPLPEPPPLSI